MDLSKQPPRSPRVRLGGYVILPRMLDKCRAALAGTAGDYKYACPLDQQFLNFTGIDAEALQNQVKSGKGDGEILEWIQANAGRPRSDIEIQAWSRMQDQRVPADPDTRTFFNELHQQAAPNRPDVATWFDLLDVDDYASFGGKP